MSGPAPLPILLSPRQQSTLEQLVRCHTNEQRLVRRARILLQAHAGRTNAAIAQTLGINRETVQRWRQRWSAEAERLQAIEDKALTDKEFKRHLQESLADRPRPGAPATFSAQQVVRIVALACEDPLESGLPITAWTPQELAQEAIKRGVVAQISASSVERFLKRG